MLAFAGLIEIYDKRSGPVDLSVPSPCTGVCRLDANNLCIGCGRLLAEIAAWSSASEAERREICRLAELRQKVQNTQNTRTP